MTGEPLTPQILVVENDPYIGQSTCRLLIELLSPLGIGFEKITWVIGTYPKNQTEDFFRVERVVDIDNPSHVQRLHLYPGQGFMLALLDGNLGEPDEQPGATHGWHLARPIKESGASIFYMSGLPQSNTRMAEAAGEDPSQKGLDWATTTHKGTPLMFEEDLRCFLSALGWLQEAPASLAS